MQLIIDVREQQTGLYVADEITKRTRGCTISFENLDVGDYVLISGENRLVVERKSPEDFAASVKDGRIFRQSIELSHTPLNLMLIHGNLYSAHIWRGMKMRIPESVNRLLTRISLSKNSQGWGVNVIRIGNVDEMIDLFIYLFEKLGSGQLVLESTLQTAKKEMRTKIRATGSERHKLILQDIFLRVDRMPRKVAKELVERCGGNFATFFSWSKEELAGLGIKGFGKVLIDRTWQLFHGEVSE